MSLAGFIAIFLAIYAAVGLVFGWITKQRADAKGYKNGFWWGFLLGLIGLLVIDARPDRGSWAGSLSASNRDDALEMLSRLHQQGVLTDEEFQKKVADLLNKE